jgi:hypothetical protein
MPETCPMNGGPAQVAEGPRLPLVWTAGLIITVTLAIYWPALGTGFVGDDFMILHRLRAAEGATDVLRFFRAEFFEYYRPLGFISHAADWAIAGQNSRQFHLTNVLIHTVNAVLVLLIGRTLSARWLAGPLAALLFALHPSSSEAVIWISARFDLLATCFALAALYWMVRGGATSSWMPALLFFPAVLSKEAAVALPIAAAGWSTFRLRASTIATAARVAPWLVVLAAYGALRRLAGGISAVGGTSRIPKLAAFGICLAVLVALADGRWEKVRAWLRPRRAQCATVFVAVLAIAALAAGVSEGRAGSLAREKLAVAGFAIFYLASPVLGPGEAVFADPTTSVAWLSGAAALLVAGAVILSVWHRALDDSRLWFLTAFFAATLLPISALTEGKRYLYLPSAAVSLIVAVAVAELHGRRRRAALGLVAGVLVASAIQIAVKTGDWTWAGRMTAEGARLVDSTLAPSCGTGHVAFLTGPVGVRSVYSHFYYETFEVPRGCMPAIFQVLVRVVRIDTTVDAKWVGPSTIVITAPTYRDNFVLSEDLRHFDLPLRGAGTVAVNTPLGTLRAERIGATERLTLTLSPDVQRERVDFFYYSDGMIRPLGRGDPQAQGRGEMTIIRPR